MSLSAYIKELEDQLAIWRPTCGSCLVNPAEKRYSVNGIHLCSCCMKIGVSNNLYFVCDECGGLEFKIDGKLPPNFDTYSLETRIKIRDQITMRIVLQVILKCMKCKLKD